VFVEIRQQSSHILLWLKFATDLQQLLARDQALLFGCLLFHELTVRSVLNVHSYHKRHDGKQQNDVQGPCI